MDYFWETQYKFTEAFRKIFPDTFKFKYSLTGNGMYNLVLVKDKIYEIKVKEVKQLPEENGILTKDALKNKILENIISHMPAQKRIVSNGKIYVSVGKWYASIEVIKKLKMPE